MPVIEEPPIGRSAERAALEACLAQVATGVAAAVLVSGEAGAGKTHLVRSVLAATGSVEGFSVQQGTRPYGPIVDVVRALLRARVPAADLPASVGQQLSALVPELGERPGAVADRAALFEAIRSTLSTAASRGPLVVVLDDMQWADEGTLDMLPALVRSLRDEPVLVVIVYRSDDITRGHPIRRLRADLRREGHLEEIDVPALDDAATATLLERVLGGPAAPALQRAVVDRTGGIPFFVIELGLALAAGDRLSDGPTGRDMLDGGVLPLPESVRDAVMMRASALTPDGRAAIGVAAVSGRTFDPELVAEVAGLAAWPGDPELDALLEDDGRGALAFRHSLARDAFRDDLSRQALRSVHRALAQRLSAAGAPARTLAEHWAGAREDRRARDCFVAAAHEDEALHAYRDAATAARRALDRWTDGDDEPQRLDALEIVARCTALAGQPGEAIRAWREAVDAWERAGEPLRVGAASRGLAGALEMQGRWPEALAMRETGAEAFSFAGAAGEAAIDRLAAGAHLRSAGSFSAALAVLGPAMDDARAAGRLDLEVRIKGLQGNVWARKGEAEKGIDLVRTALVTALEAGLTAAAAEIYQRLADSLEHAGEYAAAGAAYDEAFEFCHTGGLEPSAELCLACLAAMLRQTGDWPRAASLSRQVIGSLTAAPHPRAAATVTLGSILALQGEGESARALLLEAASTARRIELLAVELLSVWGLALLEETEGRSETVVERCNWLLERWAQTEEIHYSIAPLRWVTTHLAAAGDAAGARAAAAALAHIAASAPHPEAVSALAHALGEVAMLDGDPEQAAIEFDRAAALLHPVGAPFERVESERRAAAMLLVLGRPAETLDRLAGAYRIARRLKARPLVAKLGAALAELGEPVERRLSRRQSEQVGQQGLTRRELDVLRGLAAGRTNREIAVELFLSTRTVDMHVRNILRKLDCRARADAARRASELGLLGPPAPPAR